MASKVGLFGLRRGVLELGGEAIAFGRFGGRTTLEMHGRRRAGRGDLLSFDWATQIRQPAYSGDRLILGTSDLSQEIEEQTRCRRRLPGIAKGVRTILSHSLVCSACDACDACHAT